MQEATRAKVERPRAGRVRIIAFGEGKDEQVEVDEAWLAGQLRTDKPRANRGPCVAETDSIATHPDWVERSDGVVVCSDCGIVANEQGPDNPIPKSDASVAELAAAVAWLIEEQRAQPGESARFFAARMRAIAEDPRSIAQRTDTPKVGVK